MFRGSAVATIDDKGRLKVPTDFRRTLEDRFGAEFFITSVAGDHLERVSYYGQQSRLDGQGRLLVPTILRSSATMSGEVVVSARIDHLVVWNRERFEKRLSEHPFTDDDFGLLSERGI